MIPQTMEKKKVDLKRFKPTGPWPEHVFLYTDADKVRLYLLAKEEATSSAPELIEALTAMGVQNIDAGGITRALSDESARKAIPVAAGQPVERGEDGRIEYKFRIEKNRGHAKQDEDEDDFGRVDFRELDLIEQATEGQVLAQVFNPTDGKPGEDIFGNPIASQSGAPIRLDTRLGRNVKLSDDGSQAVATAPGIVALDGTKIVVNSIYKISGDVDFETGNIKFNGDVVVLGCVREDFCIDASGTVQVAKNVERATIIAGVNVEVKGGILGKETTKVVAGQDIVASYTNHANLTAGRNINVSNEMVHTVAQAPRVLVHTGRGAVLGGELHASDQIKVRVAGDQNSGVRTLLNIEYDRELRKQICAKETEFDKIKAKLMEVKKSYDRMLELRKKQNGSFGKSAQDNFERIVDELRALAETGKTTKAEIEDLESQLSTPDDLKIVVQERMFPGVRLSILGREMRIADSLKGATFMLVDGEIKPVKNR